MTGVEQTRQLIDKDQVDFITGNVNSAVALAMTRVTAEKRKLHIVTGGHTDEITGSLCSWNVFRICKSTTMEANAIADVLIEKFGARWYFLTPDYVYGHALQAASNSSFASMAAARQPTFCQSALSTIRSSNQCGSISPECADRSHGRRRSGQQPEADRQLRAHP